MYLTLYHHFELTRRDPKANFWLNGRLVSIEKKRIFFSNIPPHAFFGTGSVTSTKNLKSSIPKDWFIFKSSKCDFWISHPEKLIRTKFQDKRMTIENVNSKWQILPWNTHFSQIFKSQ